MSDQENNTPMTPIEADTSESQAKTIANIDKGDVVLLYEAIDEGDWAGFEYVVPQAKTLEGAIRHFTAQSQNGKDGEEIVLALLNSALRRNSRQRAQAKLTPPSKIDGQFLSIAQKEAWKAERKEWLKDPVKKILVTEDEAFSYVPGEREVDSISGLQRQHKELLKAISKLGEEAKKAKAAGDTELVSKLIDEIKVQYAKAESVTKEIQARQESELNNLRDVFGI